MKQFTLIAVGSLLTTFGLYQMHQNNLVIEENKQVAKQNEITEVNQFVDYGLHGILSRMNDNLIHFDTKSLEVRIPKDAHYHDLKSSLAEMKTREIYYIVCVRENNAKLIDSVEEYLGEKYFEIKLEISYEKKQFRLNKPLLERNIETALTHLREASFFFKEKHVLAFLAVDNLIEESKREANWMTIGMPGFAFDEMEITELEHYDGTFLQVKAKITHPISVGIIQ